MKKILNIIAIGILVIVAFYIGFTVVAPKKTANVLGFKPYVVLSNSMHPTFSRGDVIIVTKQNPRELEKGDIIAFYTGKYEVVHRVDEISLVNGTMQYRTKADNNKKRDYWWLAEKDIYGKVTFKIKYVGHIILFLRSIYGIISVGTCLVLYLLYRLYIKENKSKI